MMPIRAFVGILFLVNAAIVTGAQAADDEGRGKALYENHCVGCHNETVHIRDAHKAKTFADIEKYVARWEKSMALKWSDEERSDVAHYVNEKYYKY